ncbi:MAG: ATP-binding cassette domain-containing protein, partial [Methylacidiphilales bacterium]|nr:ATP-binding cassette domain-containing protein [Candidatus Methylacidiphilales bacterium]
YEQGRESLVQWRSRMAGFIFQSYHLMPELNILENVLLPAWFLGMDQRGRAEELIELVGLKERLLHRPGELSGGEQQRVAIARALINDPALILADEPTGNLDAENSASVLNLLLDLAAKKQKALILVTHDESIADRMATRYRLTEGKLELLR